MGEKIKPNFQEHVIGEQVTEEMANIYRKAAEKVGHSFKVEKKGGEEITRGNKVIEGYVLIAIGKSSSKDFQNFRHVVFELEEKAAVEN